MKFSAVRHSVSSIKAVVLGLQLKLEKRQNVYKDYVH